MSVEDAVRFMVRVGEDPELRARLGATAGADVSAFAAAQGFAFTADELGQALQARRGELTDAELEHASGGADSTGGAVDPNALVQAVLRESYLQSTEDLRNYAQKVDYYNDLKKSTPSVKKWPP